MDQARSADPPHVALRDIHMAFDDRVVFEGLSCAFARGRISVILGGSGSGKSTLLRLVGGLVQPSSGRIEVAGQDITRLSERELYAVRSRLGMLFQGGALLDSLTVYDNLALPLRQNSDASPSEVDQRVHERLAAVGLAGCEGLLPGQLSGGMLRRAALARAMIAKPEILLCDEPFSGLDPLSLKRIESLLAGINRRLGTTLLLVSHHIPSTMRLADRVLLLLPGRVVQGTPEEMLASADPEVAGFFNEDVEETHAGDAAGWWAPIERGGASF
ncbi:MAG: ATP-binding cassette domain-containing protein [Thermodesulfobacteriota bacterium]